jgi:hypothetical protein
VSAAAGWGPGGFAQGCFVIATKSSSGKDIYLDGVAGELCGNSVIDPIGLLGCGYIATRLSGVGVTGALGGGGGSPSAGVQGGQQISNGTKVSDLGGPFAYAGASGGEAVIGGATGFVGSNSCNQTIVGADVEAGVGANLPLPGEFHGGESYTWYWTPWGQ